MFNRTSISVALCLLFGMYSSQARSADLVKQATGIEKKQLAVGLLAAQQSVLVTLLEPLRVSSSSVAGVADVQLRPAHCTLAFENAASEIYDCKLRNGFMELSPLPYASAARFRTAIYRSKTDQRLAVFAFPNLQVKDDSAALLKEIQKNRFTPLALPEATWGQAIVLGALDISLAKQQDSAAQTAFAAGQEKGEYKQLHTINETPANHAVVWGDLRALGETLIKKLDGKTSWHVPLNGYSQAITTSPGPHLLDLVFIASAVGPEDYEQALQVELSAGHTYIVSFGMDDRPMIEDLGKGVHCERRKQPVLSAASHRNSWLACSK
ncbi:MAG TPA: hypothetical protein VN247_04925 [Arenimonas sp.]|nr:hypothetical protein [Arenimonas sp.]